MVHRRGLAVVAAVVAVAAAAASLSGCDSSGSTTGHASAAACRRVVPGGVRVGETHVFRETTAAGRTRRVTLELLSHTGDSYRFRRTATGRPAVDEVERLRGCVLELPARQVSRHGVVETLSGLTLPLDSRLGAGEVTRSTATLTIRQGSRRVSLRVPETVTGVGRHRVTVPAGTFDAVVVDLSYTVRTRQRSLDERQRLWLTTAGTVRAESSLVVDGRPNRGATVVLVSTH